MCGFAGFLDVRRAGGDYDRAEVLRAMSDRIRHRGPDQDDYFADDIAALGFRRLSIIDLEGGSQPIRNEDGSRVLVFNGEIYNYQPLREELVAAGHVFTTHTDSEVLLHGYEEWGAALLGRLRGMYAFVVWDGARRQLFGARDIFGIKPFYYYQQNEHLLFGSEIKSFLPHPAFEAVLNERRLPDYLSYEYLPDRETLFEGVYKLLGGEYLLFDADAGALTVTRYFDAADYFREGGVRSREEWETLIAETFGGSVAAHQIADVEVGCFLSSGVDSSYVVSEVAKGARGVKTFTVGFAEAGFSEIDYARDFSRSFMQVENIANTVTADEFFGAAAEIQYMLDEPLPNPSEVPLYFLAQNAAKHVKVVLSGEGADELFGGYPAYLEGGHFRRYGRIPRPLRRAAASAARRMPGFKGKRFLLRGALAPYQRFHRANFVFTKAERARYLLKDYGAPDPVELAKPHFDRAAGLDEPSQRQYADIQTWLPFDILQKADRMSMAHSLELRVPYLDVEVLKVALSLPTRYRISGNVTKVALRGAAARSIPAGTAGKKKMGFPVPLDGWLREERFYNVVRTAFESEDAGQFFDRDALLELLDAHRDGRTHSMKKIWTVYSFLLWYERFFRTEVKKV